MKPLLSSGFAIFTAERGVRSGSGLRRSSGIVDVNAARRAEQTAKMSFREDGAALEGIG
jgi:hypothetical protein